MNQNSLPLNLSKHLSLSEDKSKYLVDQLILKINAPVDNKIVVKIFRDETKKIGLAIPQQKAYEILSSLMGLKNYNVALSKQVEFYKLFVKLSLDMVNPPYNLYTLNQSAPNFNLNHKPLMFSTGLKELDADLGGGLRRAELTTILGGTNIGKTLFLQSLAANALRDNSQVSVLHINLEGTRSETIMRYYANLGEMNYQDVVNQKILPALPQFNQRLAVRNMINFNITIEELTEYVNEFHQTNPIDILVVDYGQLMATKDKNLSYAETMAKVHLGLVKIAQECNCAVITAVQVMPRSVKELAQNPNGVLRSTDISTSFEIARVSNVILSINRNEEDLQKDTIRLFLEKQRNGLKNKVYTIKANFAQANLIP